MQEVEMGDGELLIHRDEEPEREYWLERNWYWLVIGFGIAFIACIDVWAPTW